MLRSPASARRGPRSMRSTCFRCRMAIRARTSTSRWRQRAPESRRPLQSTARDRLRRWGSRGARCSALAVIPASSCPRSFAAPPRCSPRFHRDGAFGAPTSRPCSSEVQNSRTRQLLDRSRGRSSRSREQPPVRRARRARDQPLIPLPRQPERRATGQRKRSSRPRPSWSPCALPASSTRGAARSSLSSMPLSRSSRARRGRRRPGGQGICSRPGRLAICPRYS